MQTKSFNVMYKNTVTNRVSSDTSIFFSNFLCMLNRREKNEEQAKLIPYTHARKIQVTTTKFIDSSQSDQNIFLFSRFYQDPRNFQRSIIHACATSRIYIHTTN
jgi:hypothetical protein